MLGSYPHCELRAHASPLPCVPVAPMTLQAKQLFHICCRICSRTPHIASNTLPECQLSSISPPDALALPLLSALCTPLPVPRPAPDPDAPVISTPSICSDSSCFSSICTSSPAQTCIVGCHTITTLSSDVLTAVQCSPTPGAQQKSEGRAV